MKPYLVAMSVGILVGVLYALLNERSPAPPVIALIGLFGILIGEQAVPIAKRVVSGEPLTAAWVKSECVPHAFGPLPGRKSLSRNTDEGRKI